MARQIEDSAADLLDTANGIVAKLSAAMMNHTGDAWALAKAAAQAQAVGQLISGCLAAFFFICFIVIFWACVKKCNKTNKPGDGWVFWLFASGVFAVIACVVMIVKLADGVMWVSIWHPEVWIAAKLMKL